ncbi:MAG: hypothetical protein ABJE95_00870 [Byssovorax sp.]
MRTQDPADNVDAYASLGAALADPSADREEVLATNGLDETGWEMIEEIWQGRFDAADEAHGEAPGIPPLVVAHAEAFARVQATRGGAGVPFERFVELARSFARGDDAQGLLRRFGTTLEEYLGAQRKWTGRMLEDAELAGRFEKAMG